ncbi:MAG TPA: hypothetical protein VFV50_10435, partial [Bdellovibrionales bacterium]|nr:hypothetical protein [Bdellovibrionales bacterium]
PKTADTLAAIDLLPVTTITCFFEPSPSDLKGFGVLYCRGEGVEALGTLLNAHIFEGRTSVRSETWIYGSTRATLETVLADRSKLVSSPAKLLDHRVQAWPEAIPHYTLELERALKNGLELPPNVFLNGNYLGDIGLSRILERARELAARILPEPALTQGKVVWQ